MFPKETFKGLSSGEARRSLNVCSVMSWRGGWGNVLLSGPALQLSKTKSSHSVLEVSLTGNTGWAAARQAQRIADTEGISRTLEVRSIFLCSGYSPRPPHLINIYLARPTSHLHTDTARK